VKKDPPQGIIQAQKKRKKKKEKKKKKNKKTPGLLESEVVISVSTGRIREKTEELLLSAFRNMMRTLRDQKRRTIVGKKTRGS